MNKTPATASTIAPIMVLFDKIESVATLSILSNKTMIGAIVLAVAGVLFIAGFITYTVVKNKRAAAALAPALAETQQKTL